MFGKTKCSSNKAAENLVWTGPFVHLFKNSHIFLPVFMLYSVVLDTQWVSLWHLLLLPAQGCFHGDGGPMGCLPLNFFILTCPRGCTPFHFLKIPTHFCHVYIWQRPLSWAGSPLKAEAGSYSLDNSSPAHTWEAGSKGCVSSGCLWSASWPQSAVGTQLVKPVNCVASQLIRPYTYLVSMG